MNASLVALQHVKWTHSLNEEEYCNLLALYTAQTEEHVESLIPEVSDKVLSAFLEVLTLVEAV